MKGLTAIMTTLQARASYNHPNPGIRVGRKTKPNNQQQHHSKIVPDNERGKLNRVMQLINEAKVARTDITYEYNCLEAFRILRDLCRSHRGID
jgi:hypothetical protein